MFDPSAPEAHPDAAFAAACERFSRTDGPLVVVACMVPCANACDSCETTTNAA